MPLPHTSDGLLRFAAYKRLPSGAVISIGTVMADNKVQADNKVRMMYGRTLNAGETVWANELPRVEM